MSLYERLGKRGEITSEIEYSPVEMMAVAASRLLPNEASVFVGTGIPMVAATLALKTHAPDLLIVFEAGGIRPLPPTLPLSVGDSRTFYDAVAAGSMCDVGEAAQLGYIDYGFLGAAQIDRYGNINTTCIGKHRKPKVFLPGSGGANDVGSLCWRNIIIMPHERRRFVKKVDFITTPGYLSGPGSREKAGLPRGTGPYRVVTDLAILGFDPRTKLMNLISVHPGSTIERIKENTGFRLLIPKRVVTTEPPSEKEIRILRTEVDPAGIYIERGRVS